ncbi:serine hydrolase domain-containing protein [Lysinibacillus sp. NPDC058147]|uniref:serine hydrolase domain-containing protein n=1 Tax=unclassified Lysinibacillus TaxID=2636778 RepID=UPI0036DD6091
MILEERLNNWVDSYNRNGYLNGTILIASNEHILLNRGFGMANWQHSVPNVPTTKFRIGSLTKAFTAMAIFQLHEKRKLNIDDYVGKYLDDYPNGQHITIFHCLTNSSGIPNYTNVPDFWFRTMRLPSTLDQLIDSFKERELEFEPGSKFGYSNSAYALLTAIIEKVSDMSYADYIQQRICHPLGMYHTGCDDGIKVVPGLASGYSFWEEPIHSAYADMSFPLGSYGLYSTTEDLFIWDRALKSYKILRKELTEKMLTPNLGSYACGWMVSEVMGKKCVHHFGDISGYLSDFLRFVDDQVTIIFLSNMNVTPVMHLSREIAKIVFDKNVSSPAPAVPIAYTNKESIVGKYVIENEDKVLTVTIKNNELYLIVPKMYGVLYKFKLIPFSHNSTTIAFLTEMIYERLIFFYSLSGEIERVQYVDCYEKTYMLHKK